MALTIQQIQNNITNKQDAREIINQIADYLESNPGGGGSSYLVYTARLNQLGTDAPVPIVLENTLGGTVVWSYSDVGTYNATLAGAFPDGTKVAFLWSAGSNDKTIVGYKSNENTFQISVALAADGTTTDNNLEMCVEIRVYP